MSSNFYPSANMGLPIPSVGIDPGPDYANNVNSSLTLVDAHDHSPGKGISIGTAGINIQSSLSLNQNFLTNTGAVSFFIQPSLLPGSSNKGALYESGVDLFFNDGNGVQIPITAGGAIAGSPGSITGLVSPASAVYSAPTFVWQSGSNIAANLDCRDVILRNSTSSSNGLTLSPPSAMSADYQITLPTLPASTSFLTIDNSGNIASTVHVDNVSLTIASNILEIANNGVDQPQIALRIGNGGFLGSYSLSPASGAFSTTSTSFIQPTNLSLTIVTGGNPVWIGLIHDHSTPGSDSDIIAYAPSTTQSVGGSFAILNSSTIISRSALAFNGSAPSASWATSVPPTSICTYDFPSAGTQSYSVQVKAVSGSGIQVNNVRLMAYEIK